MRIALSREEVLDTASLFSGRTQDFAGMHSHFERELGRGYKVTVVFKVAVRTAIAVDEDGAVTAATSRLARLSRHIPTTMCYEVCQSPTGVFIARLLTGSFITHSTTINLATAVVDNTYLMRTSERIRPHEHVHYIQVVATKKNMATSVVVRGKALEAVYNRTVKQ